MVLFPIFRFVHLVNTSSGEEKTSYLVGVITKVVLILSSFGTPFPFGGLRFWVVIEVRFRSFIHSDSHYATIQVSARKYRVIVPSPCSTIQRCSTTNNHRNENRH